MYKLLVVDDEKLMRRGIIELIDMKTLGISEVFEASNGIDALSIAKENSPDIIFADINMPIMNGLDFCNEVKKILPNSKIAMITGYDYFDYAVSALKAGVDDYILKPVSKDDISILLKKLVEKVYFEKSNKIASQISNQISELDDDNNAYKSKITDIINQNIDNHDFGLTNLAEQLGLSAGYLSSKFRDLIGQNFQDYMINLRISKAKLLLLSTNMKIYEIASKTGFEDTNYFSTTFKKHTKLSPSEFRRDAGGQKSEK